MGHFPDRSKPAEQNQDKHDKEHEAETAMAPSKSLIREPNRPISKSETTILK